MPCLFLHIYYVYMVSSKSAWSPALGSAFHVWLERSPYDKTGAVGGQHLSPDDICCYTAICFKRQWTVTSTNFRCNFRLVLPLAKVLHLCFFGALLFWYYDIRKPLNAMCVAMCVVVKKLMGYAETLNFWCRYSGTRHTFRESTVSLIAGLV